MHANFFITQLIKIKYEKVREKKKSTRLLIQVHSYELQHS